jgi:hypothetical protein
MRQVKVIFLDIDGVLAAVLDGPRRPGRMDNRTLCW